MKKIVLIVIPIIFVFYSPHVDAKNNDNSIKDNIKAQLQWDVRVNADRITVHVNNGKVKLSGTVDSFRSYNAAERNAWGIEGVITVDNNLSIDYPESVTIPTDIEIKDNITNSLLWNLHTDLEDVTVIVNNGYVTLKGAVDSYWEKLKAENIAENVNGVVAVDNLLAIVPTEKYNDEQIAERIIKKLERNKAVNAEDIDISVKNSIVTMSGSVSSWYERQEAYNAARYTPGVIDIRKRVIIEY